MYVWECTLTHSRAGSEQRLTSLTNLTAFHFVFGGRVSPRLLRLPFQLDWLAWEPPGQVCDCPTSCWSYRLAQLQDFM